ncbi:HAMP domain-containing histidine kinase [Massilia kyonggiensis]|nr:HAMP domain-containing histidine kinase [Massilia kyonggiensis]
MPPKILVPVTCALACGAIALLSSLGWLLGVPHLVSVFSGAPRMVPMTAVLMILLALGLAREAGTPRTVLPTALACGFVMAAALALLAGHALHRVSAPFVFGGDHQVSPWSVSSPVTAAMFLAVGAGLLCQARPSAIRNGQVLALGVLLLALLTLAGFLVRDTFLYDMLPGRGTSALTTLAFILLATGTLALHPRDGIMVAVAGHEPGAWVARRLLLSALAMPVLLGACVGLALRLGAIDVGTALALLVWSTMALFTAAVWYFSLVLYRFENARRDAERERQAALDQLREADAHKDDFMALLAHELRNPLAPIRAAADLLRLRDGADAEQLRRTSDVIGRQVDHITHLVDDLLDLSRVRRGLITLDKVPVDLVAVAKNAVEQVRPQVERRRHSLEVRLPQEPVHVAGDHKRLVQVLANLLGNAAKYTPEGGSIRLALVVRGKLAEVCVEDNGIGIEAVLLPRVFDSFTQGTRTAGRAEGGLGLGLALVRRLAELHGGEVVARSAGPGQGSTFVLTLPRLPAVDAADDGGSSAASVPRIC